MDTSGIFAANSLVWPLTFLLCALILVRMTKDSPITNAIVGGVAKNAGSNATAYAIAFMFGLSASLSAFYDVFSQMDAKTFDQTSWHQYAALWAKCLNPFVVAVLAYATQNKFTGGGLGGSKPPFPVDNPNT
jgi:hypothetical protein